MWQAIVNSSWWSEAKASDVDDNFIGRVAQNVHRERERERW
jgi:hypothetical protein